MGSSSAFAIVGYLTVIDKLSTLLGVTVTT